MSEIRGVRTPATPPPSGSAPESLYLAVSEYFFLNGASAEYVLNNRIQ